MEHTYMRIKQVRSTTELFKHTTYKSKNVTHNKQHCETCIWKNEWSV
jgi:hypothetical protein